jgi:hypothetical protein
MCYADHKSYCYEILDRCNSDYKDYSLTGRDVP